MSKAAMKWAEKAMTDFRVPARFREVLRVLAKYHSPSKGCFPSIRRISDDAGTCPATTKRHLCGLRDLGVISWEKKRGKHGHWDHNEYQLFASFNVLEDMPTVAQNEPRTEVHSRAADRSSKRATNLSITKGGENGNREGSVFEHPAFRNFNRFADSNVVEMASQKMKLARKGKLSPNGDRGV